MAQDISAANAKLKAEAEKRRSEFKFRERQSRVSSGARDATNSSDPRQRNQPKTQDESTYKQDFQNSQKAQQANFSFEKKMGEYKAQNEARQAQAQVERQRLFLEKEQGKQATYTPAVERTRTNSPAPDTAKMAEAFNQARQERDSLNFDAQASQAEQKSAAPQPEAEETASAKAEAQLNAKQRAQQFKTKQEEEKKVE